MDSLPAPLFVVNNFRFKFIRIDNHILQHQSIDLRHISTACTPTLQTNFAA